jgi:hypothetical protein
MAKNSLGHLEDCTQVREKDFAQPKDIFADTKHIRK